MEASSNCSEGKEKKPDSKINKSTGGKRGEGREPGRKFAQVRAIRPKGRKKLPDNSGNGGPQMVPNRCEVQVEEERRKNHRGGAKGNQRQAEKKRRKKRGK